ncbi:hypothetical protein BX070DRAFT_50840 [Coemansia spiralis]|nr:hypothetical protein BX070DRAFT_50840 [Coemansia spiralis]
MVKRQSTLCMAFLVYRDVPCKLAAAAVPVWLAQPLLLLCFSHHLSLQYFASYYASLPGCCSHHVLPFSSLFSNCACEKHTPCFCLLALQTACFTTSSTTLPSSCIFVRTAHYIVFLASFHIQKIPTTVHITLHNILLQYTCSLRRACRRNNSLLSFFLKPFASRNTNRRCAILQLAKEHRTGLVLTSEEKERGESKKERLTTTYIYMPDYANEYYCCYHTMLPPLFRVYIQMVLAPK